MLLAFETIYKSEKITIERLEDYIIIFQNESYKKLHIKEFVPFNIETYKEFAMILKEQNKHIADYLVSRVI